jgi:hypothetical protein
MIFFHRRTVINWILHSDTINKLLLHKDSYRKNAWHYATKNGITEVFEKLWDWGVKVEINIKDDLLLAKGFDGRTAWDVTAENGNRDFRETVGLG